MFLDPHYSIPKNIDFFLQFCSLFDKIETPQPILPYLKGIDDHLKCAIYKTLSDQCPNLGLSMSLSNNFNHQIYPSDLPVILLWLEFCYMYFL